MLRICKLIRLVRRDGEKKDARRAAAAAALAEIEAQPAVCDLDAAIDTVVARRLSAAAALAALVESQKLAQATVDESSVDLGAAKLEKAFFKREGDQRRAAVMSAVGTYRKGTEKGRARCTRCWSVR